MLKQQIHVPIKVFGLTGPGLKPKIYSTFGGHANHDTSEAIWQMANKVYMLS
jgi:hypothetical protein